MSYAVALPNPALGSLESYIQAVRALPVLSVEQELDYGRRLRDESDVEAARMLVMYPEGPACQVQAGIGGDQRVGRQGQVDRCIFDPGSHCRERR